MKLTRHLLSVDVITFVSLTARPVSRMTFTDVSQCLCCVTLNLHWLTVQK